MPIKIFFCYAREDEVLLNKLKIQLRPLLRQGIVDTWHDRDIEAGTEWEHEISQHLNTAQIILLLISPDFMNSDYCYGVEMKRALERHKQGEAHIVPVILRPVHWQEEPLQMLQALPTDAKPIKSWPDLDEALFNVADGIRRVIKEQWIKKSSEYYNTEFYGEALQALTQAIRLDSRSAQLYKVKGDILYKLKQSEDALEAFEQSILLEPNDADTYSKKAVLLNELGRFQDALTACERAIELDVSYVPAYYAGGQALQKLTRYQDALEAYESAIQLNSNYTEAYEGKGETLSTLRRYQEALIAYQQVARLKPDNASTYAMQGKMLRHLGHITEALTAIEHAISLEPNDAHFYREKAIILRAMKRIDDAREAYRKARQLDKGSSLIEIVVESIQVKETKPGIVILKEKKQDRHLRIQIANEDASVIANKHSTTSIEQLPRLHNLPQAIITGLGASIVMVVISELIEDTLHGSIMLKIIDKQVEVDAHIADIIAVAIHNESPIFIEEDVLERTSEVYDVDIDLGETTQDLDSVLHEKEAILQARIKKFLQEVSAVGDGDLRVQAEVTPDTFGVLAESFNHMIEELAKVVGRVQSTAIQVTNATRRILDRSAELTHATETQVKQIAQTTEAVEALAIFIQELARSTHLTEEIAQDALRSATTGQQATRQTTDSMTLIRENVQETAKKIKRLGERSNEIGEIVRIIEDIADQTNLLALNAAIQSAMAGEHGRRFAVVADEIRLLAERSKESTKRIATLVKSIQGDTYEAVVAMEDSIQEVVKGSQLADDAGRSLNSIHSAVERQVQMIESIARAANEQTLVSEAVAIAVGRISEITRQTDAGTQEATVSVSYLAELSEQLHASVSTFRLPDHTNDSA